MEFNLVQIYNEKKIGKNALVFMALLDCNYATLLKIDSILNSAVIGMASIKIMSR